jgi:hypothetical protein
MGGAPRGTLGPPGNSFEAMGLVQTRGRPTQLKEKGKTRPHKQISRRLPAGSGVLGAVPKAKDYASAKKGGKKQVDVDAYCQAVRGATETCVCR